MTANLDFKGRVAIVTGAGTGLGRAHALALARRGAAALVNDLDAAAAQVVCDEIAALGGIAKALAGSVTDPEIASALAQEALTAWGRIDILVQNAGILRDKSFAKMPVEDFRLVFDVHVMGAVLCCKAVWPTMMAQGYGRILLTTSAAGLFGNFGQANYGAAKMALVGLMQTLGIEGRKYGIHVNTLMPTAATRMTEAILDAPTRDLLSPEMVTPAMIVLTHSTAPTRTILAAGGGSFEAVMIGETQGIRLPAEKVTAEALSARMSQVLDRNGAFTPDDAFAHVAHELGKSPA